MEALLVVLGSVLGFAGSFAAGIFVNRRELIRQQRVEIFRDVLPTVAAEITPLLERFERSRSVGTTVHLASRVDVLGRLAAIAGGTDAERVEAMVQLNRRIQAADPWQHGGPHCTRHGETWTVASVTADAQGAVQAPMLRDLLRLVEEYQRFLGDKLR